MRNIILQTLIDVIRRKAGVSQYIKDKFDEAKKCENVTTIALGSSHMACSYVPQEGELNLAFDDCDLYYMLEIYKKFNYLAPKNILVSYSVFSSGHSLIMTFNRKICAVLKVLLGIDYQYEDVAKKHNLSILEFLYKIDFLFPRIHNQITHNIRLKMEKPATFDSEEIANRAKKHLKNHNRPIKYDKYLRDLFDLGQNKNEQIFVLIPPFSAYYRNALPTSDVLFKDLYALEKDYSNVKILNFYDSDMFEESDYRDGDHLNQQGREKLSAIIRAEMNKTYCIKHN